MPIHLSGLDPISEPPQQRQPALAKASANADGANGKVIGSAKEVHLPRGIITCMDSVMQIIIIGAIVCRSS
jgi:hypothetical protein